MGNINEYTPWLYFMNVSSNGWEHLAESGCRSYFGNRHVEMEGALGD